MKAIVPIAGYGILKERPILLERTQTLLQKRGFDWLPLSTLSIFSEKGFDPSKVWIPFVIDVLHNGETYTDIVQTILSKFKTAFLLADIPENLQNRISNLDRAISLWNDDLPPQTVQKAIRQIFDKLDQSDLNVSDIAKYSYVSDDTLERMFRRWKNCSVWQFIIMQRLREGKRLLLETSYSVSEIALSVGYSDLSSFDRAFKDKFKLSPAKLRENASILRGFVKHVGD